jgi:hypothetical protein
LDWKQTGDACQSTLPFAENFSYRYAAGKHSEITSLKLE